MSFAIFFSPALSMSSNALYPLLSTSMKAITSSLNTGTTISDQDLDEPDVFWKLSVNLSPILF